MLLHDIDEEESEIVEKHSLVNIYYPNIIYIYVYYNSHNNIKTRVSIETKSNIEYIEEERCRFQSQNSIIREHSKLNSIQSSP